MKLLNKIYFTSFFLFFSTMLFGQTITRQINWKQNKIITDSLENYSLLNFENAEYIDFEYPLPYFYELINLKKYSEDEYYVKLENPVFVAFGDDELQNVKNLEKIPEKINLKFRLSHSRKISYLTITILPLRRNKNSGKIEKLTDFNLKIQKKSKRKSNKKFNYAENSVLASGTFFKIKISESGVYKITYDELQNIGIENPENVRIFGNTNGMLSYLVSENRPDDLLECDIINENNSVVFYAQGPQRQDYNEVTDIFKPVNHLYSDYSYYFITSDYSGTENNEIQTINSSSQNENHNINTYNSYKHHDIDSYNLIESGRTFYGELFDVELSQSFTFNFPNLLNNSTANVEVRAAASSSSSSSFTVICNNATENMSISPYGDHTPFRTRKINFDIITTNSDDIIVNITYNRGSNPGWKGRLDYIIINAKSELRFSENQMSFRNTESVDADNISKFTLSNADNSVKIWDISNPIEPKQINTNISGNVQTFKLETSELREFIAFNSYKNIITEEVVQVENQNLHGISGNTDMIIISHLDFFAQATELKEIHETRDNMNIIIVNPEQIYNEFSSGSPDVSAIRNFAKCIYEKGTSEKSLKYLLLFGDGSYVNKGEASEYGNYILTYQSFNSNSEGSSYMTDDFFGYLDNGEGAYDDSMHGLLDIGIGRIPASTTTQASNHINKIKTYISSDNFGDWRNELCFVADDENGVVHMADADTLTRYIKENYPYFNIEKIYFDAYPQTTVSGGERYPDVNKAITNRVQKGALLINYTGHGGIKGWAHERTLTINEIDSWTNKEKLPMFVTATCEFTPFDNYNFLSAGERIFHNTEGGAIAMFTTARLAYIYSNSILTKRFYETVFSNDENGKRYRLGDISRITKNRLSNVTNNKIFFLLGDPALELGFAKYNVVTNTINGYSPATVTDTLKALGKITFTGEIRDDENNKKTDFNGIIYPTVFDKKQNIATLNNDGGGIFNYENRNNIIYRGKASVKNGDFSFSFIVPKDIMLNIDTGKVSYYAENGIIDAKGSSFDFFVGDFSKDFSEDKEGPVINLFMNDNSFVSGGITDKNPKIYAELQDENGINTSSGGIGHEITAVLDGDVKNILLLNNDYRSDLDSYQSGKIEHYLFDLETGNHNLKFKAWDVYNNSSEEYIEFLVVESEKLSIEKLLNYPNPFTTHTDFYFEHNQAGTDLDVLIQIFTVSGKLVKTIENSFTAYGYRAGPFSWNGTDDFGNRIGRGVYIYRVKVRSLQNEIIEKYEKLLILK